MHTSVPVGDSVRKLSRALEDRQRIIAWAEQNVCECHFDCDDGGRLTVSPFSHSTEYRIFCPLLSHECPRGIKFAEQIAELSLKSLPSDIPTSFRKFLIKPKETLAVYGASRWNGKGFLYLCGSTGTGKSFAAAWRIFEDLHKQIEKYWDSPGLWRDHANCTARWFSAFAVCMERTNLYAAEAAPMLVIDDLGCELHSPANAAILNELIGVRYNFARPTIITSNLALSEFSARYQPRMYERILQSNNIVDTGEENLRLVG